ncbi:MAG: hypothetical protein NVSMB32_01780 [Actinomycetota bacterium]
MAVRQLHYCTHCGLPLLALMPFTQEDRRALPTHFCHTCGSPVRAGNLGEGVGEPAPFLVPPPQPEPGLLRWSIAAAIDLFLSCVSGLLSAALATQVAVMVTAGASGMARGGRITSIAWVAAALAVLAYQPFFWLRRRPSPGRQLLGMTWPRPRLTHPGRTPRSALNG